MSDKRTETQEFLRKNETNAIDDSDVIKINTLNQIEEFSLDMSMNKMLSPNVELSKKRSFDLGKSIN